MLNAPPPSANVPVANAQSPQLLSTPNSRSVQSLQGYARMGLHSPGGLSTPGSAANWPTAGFASGVPGLSQNPLQRDPMASIVAALRGQR